MILARSTAALCAFFTLPIDFGKLRDEFASKVQRKHAALQDIRDMVEKRLAQMLARNPMRMDFYKKYQEIIADYNREKDRVTVEETFARLRNRSPHESMNLRFSEVPAGRVRWRSRSSLD